jgi:hypothetical protein
MQRLDLPHIPGCLVSGRDVPNGLMLNFEADVSSGIVHSAFTPPDDERLFQPLTDRGLLALTLDRAMNWAATWCARRFCTCEELTMRLKKPPVTGQRLLIEARVEFSRPKLIQSIATLRTPSGGIVAVAEAKYVPMEQEQSDRLMQALIGQTQEAVAIFTRSAQPVPATR